MASTAPELSSDSQSQAVAASVFQINSGSSIFRHFVNAIGTSKDTPKLREKLLNTRQHLMQLIKDTSPKIIALSDHNQSADTSQSKESAGAKLAKGFQAILKEIQETERLAQERDSSYMVPVAPISPEIEKAIQDLESQPILLEQKRRLEMLNDEVERIASVIGEGEPKIIDAQHQIGEINNIITDLAVLMQEQDIDISHSNTQENTIESNRSKPQLIVVTNSKTRSLAWCWLLLAVIVMAIIVLLVMLYLSATNTKLKLRKLPKYIL